MKRTIILAAPAALLALLFASAETKNEAGAYALLTAHYAAGAQVSYKVNPTFTDTAAGTAAQQTAALQRGAGEWKSAGQCNFEFVYGGSTTTTTVAPTDGTNAVFYSNADGGGALATCFYAFSGSNMVGFDIQYYDRFGANDFVWAVSPTGSQFDIESVAVHEFGHALGMDHSAVAGATMFPSVSAGSTANRTLAADDIAGVQAIYGVSAVGTPTISSVTPPYAWIGGGTRITISGTHLNGGDPQIVRFDGIDATDVTAISSTTLECDLPAGIDPGECDVFVSHAQGSTTSVNGFFFTTLRETAATSISSQGAIEIYVPQAGGRQFSAAPAFGFQPGIALSRFDAADTRIVPLNEDDLFQAFSDGSFSNVFPDFAGSLSLTGQAFMHTNMPMDPQINGAYFVVTAVVFNDQATNGIGWISNALTVVVQP